MIVGHARCMEYAQRDLEATRLALRLADVLSVEAKRELGVFPADVPEDWQPVVGLSVALLFIAAAKRSRA